MFDLFFSYYIYFTNNLNSCLSGTYTFFNDAHGMCEK